MKQEFHCSALFSALFLASFFDLQSMFNCFPALMENMISIPAVGHLLGIDGAADIFRFA
jgi:hypothetical protein